MLNKIFYSPLLIGTSLAQISSAYPRMEDARVVDRELQTTTERNIDTRTIARMIQVDLSGVRAARNVCSEKTQVP